MASHPHYSKHHEQIGIAVCGSIHRSIPCFRVTPLETLKHPIKTVQMVFRKKHDPLKGVVLAVSFFIIIFYL